MDTIFKGCVDFLVWLADKVGMSYNVINVWIFVIIEPVIFLFMLSVILLQRKKIKSWKKKIKVKEFVWDVSDDELKKISI